MHKIAFICVDYNGYDCTRKFCDSLEQQAGKDDDFLLTCVVVDNCPQGEASAQLSDMVASRKWAVYLPSEKNVGYFGGLNLGLTSIDSDGWDFVVICNNDLEFDVDFCKKLISARYSDAVFAVCPDVVTRDGFHQNPHLLHRIGLLRRFQFDLYFSNYWMARFLSLILRLVRRNKPSPPRIHGGGTPHGYWCMLRTDARIFEAF
ncbi:glycosyltransferase family 2 protein [Ralstonia sp. L16]|uniref:glycosyltransferase family 2 protein n=1 Tax=Ralstonia sp. L16 TaxID=3423950 RepID=UPI003F7AC032